MTYAIELRGIVKRFPGVLANDHIDLQVEKSEIRALVGENGAGKTTLMRILYGLYQPDEGEILLDGNKQVFHSPMDAIRTGLGMVHQHFMLFPSLSVSENIIFGSEITRAGFVDIENAHSRVQQLADQYGLRVDPKARVGSLPVGVRQRVEILKMLYREAQTLILDEPTAVLTPQERDGLFVILRELARQGRTIIFITHKLNEVMDISDNATVLRGGKVSGTLKTAETSPEEISRLMVGREVLFRIQKSETVIGEPVLGVKNLEVTNEAGRRLVKDVSLTVRQGEIVGIAGVAGNGQSELVEALTGLRTTDGGTIHIQGTDITHAPVDDRRRTGLTYIPEDRGHVGLATEASVSDNLIMGYHRDQPISRNLLLSNPSIRAFSQDLIDRFGIKISQIREKTANLSGGNLQKVVLARELAHNSALLIAEQPTRGVDVGSIEFIHQELLNYREAGKGILLISAELSEILALSDRILVMYEGEIVGELEPKEPETTEERLGLYMAGAIRDQAVPAV
ncbi:MAG: ABC transporter ATP-binding protein [Anaerolineales bacterium]|nr:ABC transporter ATP-binding protein [Anaerolineales bacterium]